MAPNASGRRARPSREATHRESGVSRLTDLHGVLARITADLAAHGVEWALVCGLAVSARAEPRTNRDLDRGVEIKDDREAERIVADWIFVQVALTKRQRIAPGPVLSSFSPEGIPHNLVPDDEFNAQAGLR